MRTKRTPFSPCLALSLALAVSACAGGGGDYSTTQVHVEPRYNAGDFKRRHADKTFPVTVHGRAFGLEAQAVAGAVADALTGRLPVAPTAPVAATPDEAGISRLAIQVNPPVTASRFTLCAGEKLTGTAAREDGRTTFLMAYCYDDTPRSGATLTVAASGLNDPAFRNGLALAGSRMFPVRNPDSTPGHCRPIC